MPTLGEKSDGRRIKKYLNRNDDILIMEPVKGHLKDFKQLITILKSLKLQNLDFDPIIRSAPTARDTSLVRFHTYHNDRRDNLDLNLDSLQRKYLYVWPEDTDKYHHFYALCKWIRNHTEYTVVSVGKKSYAKIKNNPEFAHLNTWLCLIVS